MENQVFEGIIGYKDIKRELLQLLDQLKEPAKYAALGITEPHGLMLHGAPGVGKSSFAQCFVKATGRRAFICRKDKPNGDFVKEISRIFDEAAENAPSVILLDDLDKFANEDEAHRDAEEFVTVQACIDRVKDKQVFVVATANSIRKLPESLVRAGRFDSILRLNCPEGKEAQAIVEHYLSKKSFVGPLDTRRIGRLLEGRSCAQLETMVNQAGVYAAFDGRQQIEMKDMIRTILRVVFDAPEKSEADERSLPLIACHEAGHALVAELLEPDSVDLVTVLTHDSQAAGITALYRDEGYFHSQKLMAVRVMVLLAGKAATEVCHGTVDPGVISDLRRAFDIVHRFVDDYCSFGFDKFVYTQDPSNDVRARRDAQVASELDRYYGQVRQLLVENRDKLERLTKLLVQEKTLLGDQVQAVIRDNAA